MWNHHKSNLQFISSKSNLTHFISSWFFFSVHMPLLVIYVLPDSPNCLLLACLLAYPYPMNIKRQFLHNSPRVHCAKQNDSKKIESITTLSISFSWNVGLLPFIIGMNNASFRLLSGNARSWNLFESLLSWRVFAHLLVLGCVKWSHLISRTA